MKRIFIFILLIVTIAGILTGCKLPGISSTNDGQRIDPSATDTQYDDMDKGPVRGGTLKLFSTTPDTLNPILTNNIYVQDFSSAIFEGLVSLDKKQKPVPELSDKWDISSDGLTWSFHIRNNVFWQDNIPLSAEDVEFTLQTILNPAINSVYKTNVQNIASFSAVDANTFRITLKAPNSFTAEMMTFPIIPKHYFAGEDILTSPRNMRPVGTGPYRLLSYDDNSTIKLIMNEKWWNSKSVGKDTPTLPYIAEIDIKIYQNIKDAVSAFQTRDVDTASIDFDQCIKYTGRSDLIIKKYAGRDYDFIAFNMSRPILADKAVRQAISYAIDKFKIVNDVLSGEAIASDLPVIPDTWLYDSNIVSYTPSISKAKDTLSQDGWKEDSGGIYKNINGIRTPLSLEIMVNDDDELRFRIASNIKDQLKAVGINLDIAKVGWDDEIKRIGSRQFDMVLTGWSVSSIPDLSFAYSSTQAGTTNIAGYSNAAVDNYLTQILNENDSDRKKALFINMKEIIDDEVPYIGLCFYNNAVLFNKRIRGDTTPFVWDKYNGLSQWYIPVS